MRLAIERSCASSRGLHEVVEFEWLVELRLERALRKLVSQLHLFYQIDLVLLLQFN